MCTSAVQFTFILFFLPHNLPPLIFFSNLPLRSILFSPCQSLFLIPFLCFIRRTSLPFFLTPHRFSFSLFPVSLPLSKPTSHSFHSPPRSSTSTSTHYISFSTHIFLLLFYFCCLWHFENTNYFPKNQREKMQSTKSAERIIRDETPTHTQQGE